MSGHRHNSNAGTQNQGNTLGDRACVRQSKLYRTHESGNSVKCILGTANLCWDTEHQEGAYKGQKVFDHMQPNYVSNETRARSNEMKRSINNEYQSYATDWSTESGSYKGSNGAPSYRVNDENAMSRGNSGRHSSGSEYDHKNIRMATGRNAITTTSNMGGMSLAQFQSDSNAYVQPPPPQQSRFGRGGSNSEGFAAALVQPDRVPSFRGNGSARDGMPPAYEYKNNIYGFDEAPQANRSKAPQQSYKSQTTAPYAADDYSQQYQQSQYRAQYQQPAPDAYEYGRPQQQQRGTGSYGYGQQQTAEEAYSYAIPGIAAEGAGNREGRSTRPW